MKIELVKTHEADGTWLKVLQDGKNIKCWSLSERTIPQQRDADKEADEFYEEAVIRAKKGYFKVIKSEEI